MESSKIYDLINSGLLRSWKERVMVAERDTWVFIDEKEAFKELEEKLNSEEKRLLKSYSLALENKLDYVYYNLKIKLLNLGIKIGMELEKAFTQYDE